jgi:molybdopterin converting factor small subunit
VLDVDRPAPPAGTPPLGRLLSRSSFLLNEVAVRDRSVVLGPNDVVDVLPPFAGG